MFNKFFAFFILSFFALDLTHASGKAKTLVLEDSEDSSLLLEEAFEASLKEYFMSRKYLQRYWGVVSANYADAEQKDIEKIVEKICGSKIKFEIIKDSYIDNPSRKAQTFNKISQEQISECILYLDEKSRYYRKFGDILKNAGAQDNETQEILIYEEDRFGLSASKFSYLLDIFKKYSVIRSFLNQKFPNKYLRTKMCFHEGGRYPLGAIKDAVANLEFDAMQEKGLHLLECLTNKKHHKTKTCVKGKCILDKFPKTDPTQLILFSKLLDTRLAMLNAAFEGEFISQFNRFEATLENAYLEAQKRDKESFDLLSSLMDGSSKKKKTATKKKAHTRKKSSSSACPQEKREKSGNDISAHVAPSSTSPSLSAPSRHMTEEEVSEFEREAIIPGKKKAKKVKEAERRTETSTSSSSSSSSSSGSSSSGFMGGLKKKISTYAEAAKTVLSPQDSFQNLYRRHHAIFNLYTNTKRLQQDTERKLLETQQALDSEKDKAKELEAQLEDMRREHEDLVSKTQKSEKTSAKLMEDLSSLQKLFVGKALEGGELRHYTENVLAHAAQIQEALAFQQMHMHSILAANQGLYQSLQQCMAENAALKAEAKTKESES